MAEEKKFRKWHCNKCGEGGKLDEPQTHTIATIKATTTHRKVSPKCWFAYILLNIRQ
jgi:hypothetical protein